MEKFKLLKFDKLGDENGYLISLEENRNISFTIKRVFYIFGTKKDIVRGKHALRKGKQLLIAVHGECKVLVDDGFQREVFHLDNQEKGLLINGMVWREMYDFSKDCVLLVISDEHFSEEDYIHDYQEFLQMVLVNDRGN